MDREIEELNDELRSVAIDAARFKTEIGDLSIQRSAFVLGERKETLLVVKGGGCNKIELILKKKLTVILQRYLNSDEL